MSCTIIVQFNHYDGIVRILEVEDAIRGKMGADRGDMTSSRNPSQDMGEGMGHKVKEEGRSRVTLPQALPLAKTLQMFLLKLINTSLIKGIIPVPSRPRPNSRVLRMRPFPLYIRSL